MAFGRRDGDDVDVVVGGGEVSTNVLDPNTDGEHAVDDGRACAALIASTTIYAVFVAVKLGLEKIVAWSATLDAADGRVLGSVTTNLQ